MITLEEMKAQGLQFAGQSEKPSFIISSRTDKTSFKQMSVARNMEALLNTNLNIEKYSSNRFKHITLIYNVLNPTNKGVDWDERKYYLKKEKQLRIEIKFSDYEKFIASNKQEALRIMAEETIRGTDKFLHNEKDFDHERFRTDLLDLFRKEGILD